MNTLLQHDSDYKIREEVEAELRWAPELYDAARIGVSVHNGVVTLSGEVPSYPEKVVAGKAALRTKGVTAIANDLIVRYNSTIYSDAHLAGEAQDALRLNALVPRRGIEIEVRSHVIFLGGAVDWDYQRQAAEHSLEHLPGVHDVVNDITLRARAASGDTHDKIRRALVRSANIDANRINVEVDGTAVTLTGTVSSFAEKKQAAIAVWSSPNVKTVHNELMIEAP
ncbi:MAG: BON domain-containing protein [Aeromicrobium sp.]